MASLLERQLRASLAESEPTLRRESLADGSTRYHLRRNVEVALGVEDVAELLVEIVRQLLVERETMRAIVRARGHEDAPS